MASAEGRMTPTMERQWRRKQRWDAVRFWFRCLWASTGYRPWARLLHRVNLHHTKTITMMDGSVITRCEWCGLSAVEYSPERLEELARMDAGRQLVR